MILARQKQAAQSVPQVNTLETTVARVKKDMLWVFISVVISIAAGLIIGNFIKF
jgi:hypothetical protein